MTHPAFETLKPKLDAAMGAGDPHAIAASVKDALQEAFRAGLDLPPALVAPRPDTYARRLLHRDAQDRYTVVVMTWGPGQRTALHDHAGIWCVECVVNGEMEVAQYDLVSEEGGRFRFAKQNTITASRGSAGCLIPPFEYHTLANARGDRASVTLHVYGGEMDHCHAFEPAGDDTYTRVRRELSYHA